ncbi:hypothetical protein BofuT4_P063160.1 [Botrytis cinerea T4]|uniref:Uncharacterized protein n=1 Tax=Botryotinia fuckeliana (strain T4) TaxID=999810 RepID=G2XTQ0_BOTF4|nr:hypothetical protein BofuT4_P063160.1 [Botrytis cinerea T4]
MQLTWLVFTKENSIPKKEKPRSYELTSSPRRSPIPTVGTGTRFLFPLQNIVIQKGRRKKTERKIIIPEQIPTKTPHLHIRKRNFSLPTRFSPCSLQIPPGTMCLSTVRQSRARKSTSGKKKEIK